MYKIESECLLMLDGVRFAQCYISANGHAIDVEVEVQGKQATAGSNT
jgi:hypothetical protein